MYFDQHYIIIDNEVSMRILWRKTDTSFHRFVDIRIAVIPLMSCFISTVLYDGSVCRQRMFALQRLMRPTVSHLFSSRPQSP